jgi:hypothetical protein
MLAVLGGIGFQWKDGPSPGDRQRVETGAKAPDTNLLKAKSHCQSFLPERWLTFPACGSESPKTCQGCRFSGPSGSDLTRHGITIIVLFAMRASVIFENGIPHGGRCSRNGSTLDMRFGQRIPRGRLFGFAGPASKQ